MSLVEDAYRAAVDAMTPAQKIARMLELNQWAHWNIERCITAERGPLSPEAMKWQVARWIYGRNPACRQLIEEHLAPVSTRRVSQLPRQTWRNWMSLMRNVWLETPGKVTPHRLSRENPPKLVALHRPAGLVTLSDSRADHPEIPSAGVRAVFPCFSYERHRPTATLNR